VEAAGQEFAALPLIQSLFQILFGFGNKVARMKVNTTNAEMKSAATF
jgi:hypothetical protein